jgi:hypothetical protein
MNYEEMLIKMSKEERAKHLKEKGLWNEVYEMGKTKAQIVNDLKEKYPELFSTPTPPPPPPNSPFLEQVYNYLIKSGKIENLNQEEWKLPRKIEFYPEFDIDRKDSYIVKQEIVKPEKQFHISEVPVFIASPDNKYAGYFWPVKSGSEYFLTAKRENINTGLLKKYGKAILYFVSDDNASFFKNHNIRDEGLGRIQLRPAKISINVKEAEKTKDWLCIDFGTSNTTVGTYGKDDAEEIVRFYDPGDQEYKLIFPTVVYVKNIQDDKIDYLFGYDAKKKERDEEYHLEGSIFYEIKRWVNTTEQDQEIIDENGTKCTIKRIEIIAAYLKHVLELAEHQFKKKYKFLHFSAPVKMKEKYLKMFEQVFPEPEYKLAKNEKALDEGFAIIYHHISTQILRNKGKIQEYPKEIHPDMNEMNVMIIDSGGGTTDLASCAYHFKYGRAGTNLFINTKFEESESNFGGNNLTYRIMQFLKLKLANHYMSEGTPKDYFKAETIIEDDLPLLLDIDNVLEKIEKNLDVYAKFDQEYERAEKIIPTMYREHDELNAGIKVRQNFYLLWNMAETMKKEFFKRNDVVMMNLSKADEEKGMYRLPQFSNLNLALCTGDSFVEFKELPDLTFTDKDIRSLIYGDIYRLLFSLLAEKEENNELNDYSLFKFSGQTSKISILEQLLKEFVPGRRLRGKSVKLDRDKSDGAPEELKLQCLKGSIYYSRDKARGKIIPNITNESPKLKYTIRSEHCDDLLLKPDGNSFLMEADEFDPAAAREVKLEVFRKGIKVNELVYSFSFGKPSKPCDLKNILPETDDYTKIKEKLNEIEGDRRIILIYPTRDRFAFVIKEITKIKGNFYTIHEEEHSFDPAPEKVSFFNGEK